MTGRDERVRSHGGERLADEERSEEQPGLSGDPEQGTGDEPQKPDTSAELEELKRQLQAGREELAELRGKLSQPQPAKAEPAQPRDLTREELRAMVDRGDITEDQMFERLLQQERRRFQQDLATELDRREAEQNAQSLLSDELAKYRARIPSIDMPGSPERQRVEAEYQRLVRSGFPADERTEITALRGVFGPPESVPERRRTSDTHQEGGASSEPRQDGSGSSGGGWKKGLPPAHVAHYENLLKRGLYRGTDDPAFKKDIEFARKSKRGEARAH